MAYKFTFKAQKCGPWDDYKAIDIKYRGNVVGYMQAQLGKKWYVRLQVPASKEALKANPNCPWTWAKLIKRFESAEEAKTWLNENRESLLTMIYFEKSELGLTTTN